MTSTTALRNGVDTATLFATLDAVKAQPEIATFQFRATTDWVSGTHNTTTIDGFYGAGAEQHHARPTHIDADHPAVLVGEDHGPTPAEHLLQALGSCLMAGLANIAAARGIELKGVRAHVTGDIDLLGIFGLDDSVRNGFSGITVAFEVEGDAEAAQLERLVDQARARSAVFDVITNGTPVTITTTVR